MQAKTKPKNVETVAVNKQDLIDAWRILEKLVVSIHKIGSVYSVPTKEDLTPEIMRKINLEIGDFVSEHILNDANHLRILLSDYLPNDEAEALSDQIEHWQAPKP